MGASGIAVAEGRVIVAGDRPDELFPVSDINDRFFEVTGYRSMIIAPISGESGPLGALEVYSAEAGAFDDDDAAVIRSLAYQAAIAIQNARLIEELDRSREEIAPAGRRRSVACARSPPGSPRSARPDDLLQHVVDEAARLLDSDGAIIDLLDPVTGAIAVGYDRRLDADRSDRCAGAAGVGEDIVRRAARRAGGALHRRLPRRRRFAARRGRPTEVAAASGSGRSRSRRSSSERGALGDARRSSRPSRAAFGERRGGPPRRPRRPGRDRDR